MADKLDDLARESKNRRAATERQHQLIRELREEGHSFRAIAQAAGMTPHAIEKIVQKAST